MHYLGNAPLLIKTFAILKITIWKPAIIFLFTILLFTANMSKTLPSKIFFLFQEVFLYQKRWNLRRLWNLLVREIRFTWNRKNSWMREAVKFKGAFSSLRQLLANENPSKMMKNVFYFTLKALFVRKIFPFLSWLFGHV